MTFDRLRAYLDEMLQVASETTQFVRGVTKEAFLEDLLMQRAIGMNLLMIGETTARVLEEYPDVAAQFDDISWRKIRGMRNRIAHNYMGINLETVWDTALNAVPSLTDRLYAINHWRAQGE